MTRTLLLVVAGGIAALTSAVVASAAPPDTDPADEETATEPTEAADAAAPELEPQDDEGPAVERRDAESAFALFLSMELKVPVGTFTCSEPGSRDVGEPITCFTLIDDQRVIVATTHISETPGAFDFEIVSDYTIGSTGPTTTTTTTSTTSPVPTTTLPVPFIVTTALPLSQADRDLLAYGDSINRQADSFVDEMINSADGFVTAAAYSWDPSTTSVVLDVTMSEDWGNQYDTAAWVIASDRARELWNRDRPFRAEGATIRPNLVIVVNGNRYLSDFDLCVEVADQTISMEDWLDEARQE